MLLATYISSIFFLQMESVRHALGCTLSIHSKWHEHCLSKKNCIAFTKREIKNPAGYHSGFVEHRRL